MSEAKKSEQPTWASHPLNIHDLLEAARENILGCAPSVPVSSLSRSELGLVNTILERHYKVSMQREHTGYRHVRTCRQMPPLGPHALQALSLAQAALASGATLAQTLDVARGHMRTAGVDLQPIFDRLPLEIDVAAVEAAESARATQARAAGTERSQGVQQQWTVHHLAIEPTEQPMVRIVDRMQAVYDELPDCAWERRPAPVP